MLSVLGTAARAEAEVPADAAAADGGTPAAPPLEAFVPGDGGTSSASSLPPPATVAVLADGGVTAAGPPGQLEEVVVVGHSLEEKLPQELAAYGTRVDTVTADEIQNAGYVDVPQSLATLVPGLYINPKNGPFDYVDISLQGSRTQDVLWLLDGVRLNNRLYGGTPPLDTFPSSFVERIEVLGGPQALFYGTQAIAGAVNIVTKDFGARPDGSLSLGADTNHSRFFDGYVRDTIRSHKIVLYGSSAESNGFRPFRAEDYQPSATDRERGYTILTLGAKYGYDLTKNLALRALYQHTDAHLDFIKPFAVASSFNQRDEDILSLKMDYSPEGPLQVFGKGYYHWWRSHYTEFDNVPGTPGMISVVDDHDFWGYKDYGLNLVAKVAVANWLDSYVGYDVQSYSGNDAVLVITQKTEYVNALLAQLRTPERLERIRLAAGFRYNIPSVGPSAAVWSANGQYSILDRLYVRGTAATAFRLPTAEELFANDPNDERGNPDLRPERSLNFNLAMGGYVGPIRDPRLAWEAAGFYRDVTDLISANGFDMATNQSLFENIPGKVRVRGGTAVVSGRIMKEVSGNASYTYSSAEQTGAVQIDRVPKHQAKVWLDYHPTALPFGVTGTGTYVGTTYRTFGDTDREKVGEHLVIDLAGRVYLDAERRHTISLRLSNVFNAVYATSLGKGVTDADGRSYTYWNLGLPRTLQARYAYKF